MPEKNSIIENQQELKFSGEQGFFDKSKTIRFFIIALLALTLFVFLHFREVQVDTLELNSIAPGYIVSQVNFEFNDDEATLILRQNAIRDIDKIYQISRKDIYQKRTNFESYIRHDEEWQNQADTQVLDELYKDTNLIEKILLQTRFTDSRTLEKIKEHKLSFKDYQVFSPNQINSPITLPNYIWDNLQKEYFSNSDQNPAVISTIIDYFKQAQWNLEEDIPVQKQVRKSIQATIPEKKSYVNAGSRIIDQGEKVTARHIAMLQAMKQNLGESRHLSEPLTLLGTLLLTGIFIAIFLVYFKINQATLLLSNRKLFLLITILILTLAAAKLMEFFLLNLGGHLSEFVRYPLFVPLAAILISSLISNSIAIFSSGLLALITAMALAFEWQSLLILNLFTALVAIFNTNSLLRRKEIFVVCLKSWVCAVITLIALHLYNNNGIHLSIVADVFSAGWYMLLTAVVVVGILPLLESGFSVMTDVTLMEYMDPANPLLRRLTMEAPGTYQHSVIVGNLAEASALAIKANGLFCRVAALYHDVGKIATSQYFTENQLEDINIHQLLTPIESAQVIMAHVLEGVALAREAGLPEPIIDVIKEHHGTTLVYYFYCKQLEKMGNDKSKVNEKDFRYSGPKPRMKESGIIMISDSFEAASRSLEVVSEETLTDLVERIVREKVDDGQFDQCLLTFEELWVIKRTLVKTLLAAGHSRVKYPKNERKRMTVGLEEIA